MEVALRVGRIALLQTVPFQIHRPKASADYFETAQVTLAQFSGGRSVMPRMVLLVDILLVCLLFTTSLTAQWVPTNGPYGGRVSAVGVASDSSGGKVFLAGGDASPLAVYGYGIYRSTDEGLTWARSDSGSPSSTVYAFFAAGGYIFAGTSKGAYRSSDYGRKWELVNTGLKSLDVRSFAVRDTLLFAGTYGGGVSRSTDWGETWVNTGLNVHGYTLAVSGRNLFVGIAAGGVYRSTDDGASWTAFNTGLGGAYVWQLAVMDTFLFAGTQGSGMFRSSVNTAAWQSINSGLPPISLDISVLTLTGTEIFVSLFDRSGLYGSTDNGTSWTSMTAGLGGREITALAVSDSTFLAGTYGHGVVRSTDNGVSWSEANTGLAMADLALLGVQGRTLFVGTGTSGAFRSTDDGDHWVVMDSGLAGSMVLPFAVAPGGQGDSLLYAGTSSGVFRSSDAGVRGQRHRLDRRGSPALHPTEEIFTLAVHSTVASEPRRSSFAPPTGERVGNGVSQIGGLRHVAFLSLLSWTA
jgi:hypothetical protein